MRLLRRNFVSLIAFIVISFALFATGCISGTNGNNGELIVSSKAFNPRIYKADTLFIVAMPEEGDFLEKEYAMSRNPNFDIGEGVFSDNNGKYIMVITGVGGAKVDAALAKVSALSDVRIVNVGYAGSNNLRKGQVYAVVSSAKFGDWSNLKKCGVCSDGIVCFSADKFVANDDVKGVSLPSCAFDMELSYILNKFSNVESYKIISDSLSHDEFRGFKENIDTPSSWKKAFEMINASDKN